MTTEYNDTTYRGQDVQVNKTYDINELIKDKVFWWINSRRMYHKVVQSDMSKRNILKTTITGSGKGKRYEIQGKNIIQFYKVYGPGIDLLKNN